MIGSFSGIHYRTFAAALSPVAAVGVVLTVIVIAAIRSEEHTSELQSRRDLHSFPTRRSSDLDDRQFFGNPLPDLRGGTLASRGGGVSVDGNCDCRHLPSRVPVPREGRAGSTPGAHQPRADVEVAGRVGWHDRILLRGLAGSESGAHGWRAAAGYAARETGENLPRDRLVVVGSLHWALYRGGRGGEDLPARRPVPRRATISPGANLGAERLCRPAFECREQRACGAGFQALHGSSEQSRPVLAHAGYVYHAGGQSDHPRLRRESDRSPERSEEHT